MKRYTTDKIFFILSITVLLFSLSLFFLKQHFSKSFEYAIVETEKRLYDVNRIGFEELKDIPGVGEKTAENIIHLRDSLKGFKSIKDLLKVKGIKEKRLKTLMKYFYVDED